jgi:hypothetical protein
MSGKRAEQETESNKSAQAAHHGDHTDKLHADAYSPALNHRQMNNDGTIQHHARTDGPAPKLTDLTIDEQHVKVYDTPRRDASAAERAAAAHREMPVSNAHFRDLVKSGAEFMAINDGGFNLAMKNALEEAHQTDKFAGGGHQHMDQMLKYINGQLTDTFYTLRRHGDKIQVFDTHESETKPTGTYDLNKRAWDR